ncbi:MAG: GTPase Era [Bilifractor sp.]|jgi:GTP-binding protein Era
MDDAKLKSGFVALIGRPNVGKSTLMNHLIGQKIAITSRKPQTTRNQIRTVYNDERGQIVFTDTPGIHRASNKLGEYMVRAAENSLKNVDAALWLVEPGSYVGASDRSIAKTLQRSGLPVILVINKTDKVTKAVVAATIEAFRGTVDFEDILAVSAKQGTNLDALLDSIFKVLPYGPRFFPEDTLTDQPMRQIVSEIVREKALRCLGEEVPHGIAVTIGRMHERSAGGRTKTTAAGGNVEKHGNTTSSTGRDIKNAVPGGENGTQHDITAANDENGQNRAKDNGTEKNGAENNRAENNRAENNRAENSRAENNRAENNRAENNRAENNRAENNRASTKQKKSDIDESVITDIDAEIICERESHKGIIIGRGGSMLQKIGSEARTDIEKLVGTRVNLQIHVKVKNNWRESDVLVKNFGYDKKNLD